MTLEDFFHTLKYNLPSKDFTVELEALWWAKKGNWEKAHQLAQDANTPTGDWVHAYLHREEGDLGNASYWYSQANKPVSRKSLSDEWEEIVKNIIDE